LNIEIENKDAAYAESAYLVVAPIIGTAAEINVHDRNQGIKSGFCMNLRNLTYKGPLEVVGPCSIAAYVYHNASIRHRLKTLYEVLEE